MTTRAEVLASAQSYIGVRWKFHGRDRSGLDCIGFLLAVGADIGLKLDDTKDYTPRSPDIEQFKAFVMGQSDPGAINCIRTGSILLLRAAAFPWHTGIAVLEPSLGAAVIHASIHKRKVVQEPLHEFSNDIIYVREYPGVR